MKNIIAYININQLNWFNSKYTIGWTILSKNLSYDEISGVYYLVEGSDFEQVFINYFWIDK